MKTVVFIIVCLISKGVFTQEPAHFIIGEEVFGGVDIYDLHQDMNENYWISSNSGIYKYDGYNFKKLACNDMLSSSLFNICEDGLGNIYCHNLSGQIFKIENDSCSLFYQIPDSLMSKEISINTDDSDRLIVLASCVFLVEDDKKTRLLLSQKGSFIGGELFKTKDNSLLIMGNNNKDMYSLKDEKLTYLTSVNYECLPRFFTYNEKLIAFDLNTGGLVFENGKFNKEPLVVNEERRRIYFDETNFWDAKLTGGAYVKDINDHFLFHENKVFGQHSITALLRDCEGNVILGTFGDGLIVVPNIYSSLYKLEDSEDRPTILTKGENGNVFIGSRSGKIFQLKPDGSIRTISESNSKNVECLGYFQESGNLIVDDKSPRIVNVVTGRSESIDMGSLKEILYVTDGKYLVASNSGIAWVYPQRKEKKIEIIKSFIGRASRVGYDKKNQTIYAGTSQGLKIGNAEGVAFFEIDGVPLLSRDIVSVDDLVYVCTQNKGILIFEDAELIEQWNINTGLPSNTIRELIQFKEGFVVSSDNGVYLLSQDGKITQPIKTPEGLTTTNVTDIEVVDTFLFIIHQNGLQKIDLSKLNKEVYEPKVSLHNIFVNDELYSASRNDVKFIHTKNRLTFELHVSSLKYTSEIQYKYRLNGVDNTWQFNNFEENKIEYKSIPAGTHTFEYSAVCRGIESETKKFIFKIRLPFWKTGGFLFLIGTFIVFIAYTVYQRQVKRQRKLALIEQEVIQSKLTAIQSQMNPHFIFNSLNSIQDLVLRKEGENAYIYISKFAFLVRKILHFSEVDFIDIEEEEKVLQVYLELEQLRFKEGFTFNLAFDIEDEIEIPPMIVQPFIENAIKHGLLHKQGKKVLTVNFTQDGDQLVCEVIDNGVGVKKSKEINARKASAHSSFSVKSIQSRFEILKKIFGGRLGVTFVDLTKGEKETGTKVIIRLPFKRKY